MKKLLLRRSLDVSAQEAFAWHEREGALQRLLPPWERAEMLLSEGIHDGAKAILKTYVGPVGLRWEALHSGYEKGRQFRDDQVSGPFASWRHTHRFVPETVGCQLEDEIHYTLPLGGLGAFFGGRFVDKKLARMFRFRHDRTEHDLRRHARYADREPLRIVVSGATGLVGTQLCAFLRTGGHRVDRLVRRAPASESTDILWRPSVGEIDKEALEGADAVIHLAGASIGGGRWTPKKKSLILESRVQGTRLLSETLAGLRHPPHVFVSASAIGFYGNRVGPAVDEESDAGTGFLADVCQAWESSAESAREAGIRVVHPRIGMVVAGRGGALGQMLLPFRLGLGGVVGAGTQWMSWIALDDLLGILHAALFEESWVGPINATAPKPVTNRVFTKSLGRVLQRPTIAPLPAFVVRALLGEMGEALLLEGANVLPRRLEESGFSFLFPTLEEALRHELGRQPSS